MSNIEISIDVQLTGAAGFWIERDAWEAMSPDDKRKRVGEAIDHVLAHLSNDTITVMEGDFLTASVVGPETAAIDLANVQVYDPEAGCSLPRHLDEHGQPTRYIVDGRESEHPEANDAADGEVPPFQVFDIEAQRHVPILYVDRATAQIVANALNANWRASL